MEEVIWEGKAKIIVPKLSFFKRLDGKIEPSWMPVFYNPYAKINRDLTLLSLYSYMKRLNKRVFSFLEPLAGVCVRSIRVIKEVLSDGKAYASDVNPRAIEYCRKNAELNNVADKLRIERKDANLFMRKIDSEDIVIDTVDIDPYGSPIYYVESALRALGPHGLLIVTATDLGALSGKYPSVSLRRYSSKIYKTTYSREIAVRNLLQGIARISIMMDRGLIPLYAFYHEHYVKVVLEIFKRKKKALDTAGNIGFLCSDTRFSPNILVSQSHRHLFCENYLGPLWIGALWDSEFSASVYDAALEMGFRDKVFLRKLDFIKHESNVMVPYYYRVSDISSYIHRSMPSLEKVIEKLREKGFNASRTHFVDDGFRTNAPVETVFSIFKSL